MPTWLHSTHRHRREEQNWVQSSSALPIPYSNSLQTFTIPQNTTEKLTEWKATQRNLSLKNRVYCCTFTCKNRILFLPHCLTLPFNSSLLNVLCNSIIFYTVTFFPKSLGPKCVSSVCLIIFGKLKDIGPNTASWHWLTEFTVQKQKPYEPF